MIASDTKISSDEIARELFHVLTKFCLASPRGRRRLGDLKEVEFLTLAILSQQPTMIVGDIQRLLGVLPAQMSRIIRSLETHERSFIECRINLQDKRKIDVTMTPSGEKALKEYQTMRIQSIHDLLRILNEDEQDEIAKLVDKLHSTLDRVAPTLSELHV